MGERAGEPDRPRHAVKSNVRAFHAEVSGLSPRRGARLLPDPAVFGAGLARAPLPLWVPCRGTRIDRTPRANCTALPETFRTGRSGSRSVRLHLRDMQRMRTARIQTRAASRRSLATLARRVAAKGSGAGRGFSETQCANSAEPAAKARARHLCMRASESAFGTSKGQPPEPAQASDRSPEPSPCPGIRRGVPGIPTIRLTPCCSDTATRAPCTPPDARPRAPRGDGARPPTSPSTPPPP